MATWLRCDGTSEEVHPKFGEGFTLEEIRKYVDGEVEVIRLTADTWMLVDEEATKKKKGKNPRATMLLRNVRPEMTTTVCGDALVVRAGEFG